MEYIYRVEQVGKWASERACVRACVRGCARTWVGELAG